MADSEVGFVKSVRGFVLNLDGLPSVKINDLVISETGVRAFVIGLYPNKVEALVIDQGDVIPGQLFKPLPDPLSIKVGDFLFGRAISPLGEIADSGKPFIALESKVLELEKLAQGIDARAFITRQFDSGITLIDTLVPLGRGQRELIMGDARSGKTGFLLDLIINQKRSNTVCIYASIGRPLSDVNTFMEVLKREDSLSHTIIVASFSADPPAMIYLTPKTAMSIAEYYQRLGRDVLVIMDDMGSHARIYREISLLLERFPGREAYPGDIFYEHAHLLERAGNFNKEAGGGSITALPVIELDLNDFTGFIPTNLMSMTDGHLLFKSELYSQGRRPAIDISLSVSRVGRQTQSRLQNSVSTRVKQILVQAYALSAVTGFGGELPASTQLILRQRGVIEELLNEPPSQFISKDAQTVLLTIPFMKFFADKDAVFVQRHKDTLIKALGADPRFAPLMKSLAELKSQKELLDSLEKLTDVFADLTVNKEQKDELVSPNTWLPKF